MEQAPNGDCNLGVAEQPVHTRTQRYYFCGSLFDYSGQQLLTGLHIHWYANTFGMGSISLKCIDIHVKYCKQVADISRD